MNATEDTSKKEEKHIRQRSLVVSENVLYESVIISGEPCFLIFDGKSFRATTNPLIDNNIHIYPLTEKEMYPYKPYTISNIEKMNNTNPSKQDLFKLIKNEYDTFLDLEDEYKVLETEQTLETYMQNKLNSIAYLMHIGDKASGKTRACELHSFLDYRPLFGINISKANIYRYIGHEQEGHCTIIEDEIEKLNTDKDADKLAIYRAGYRKYAKVPIITDDKARQQRFYNTFCSKIFAGRYAPKDSAFNDRCIEIPMIHGNPKKDEIEDEDILRFDYEKMLLLNYRMRNFFTQIQNSDINNFNLKGREKELWKSKFEVILSFNINEYSEVIKQMAEKHRKEQLEERRNSLDAFLAKSVAWNYKNCNGKEIPSFSIWNILCEQLEVDSDKASFETDIIGFKVTRRLIGLKLRTIFGAENHLRAKPVGRTWSFKEDRIQRILRKFEISEQEITDLVKKEKTDITAKTLITDTTEEEAF